MDIDQNAHQRTKAMAIDEIIVRLKDKIHQNQTEFRNVFKKYDIRRKGKVSKKDFRQVSYCLMIFGRPMLVVKT